MEKGRSIEVLTGLQKDILQTFFSVPLLKENFYLTGGTALSAFYLEHRISDDMDIFTHSMDIETSSILFEDAMRDGKMKFIKERSSSTFRRYIIRNSLQVDMVRDVDFRLGTPLLKDDIMVDCPKNIAMNKILAIYGRFDPKDYVDVYFLKSFLNFDIMKMMEIAKNKDGGMDAFQWARVILDAENIEILPRMLKDVTPPAVKKFFSDLRKEILVALKNSIGY